MKAEYGPKTFYLQRSANTSTTALLIGCYMDYGMLARFKSEVRYAVTIICPGGCVLTLHRQI